MDAARKIENNYYTIEDIMALPEGQRAELINGRWYDMATPTSEHQLISSVVSHKLWNYIEKNGGKCKVMPAPFAVFLNKDRRNYFEPDISVICDPDKISKRGCEGAPDLVIEITSPSTMARDYGLKLFMYRMAGVREYWVINPTSRITTVYDPNMEDDETLGGRDFEFDQAIESKMYPDFELILDESL